MITSILIAGDICPTKDTKHLFDKEDAGTLFTNVKDKINSADLAIANLEFPITEIKKGISKTGPILRGDPNHINVFNKLGFGVLSLANNHIKDCGSQGVLDTLKICKENQVLTVGAGSNIAQAKESIIKEVNGFKIGFMAFAEQEFNIASDIEAGSNYLDPYYDFDAVAKLKSKVDFLIILYHGGIEYYKYPSPLLQKKCRKLVESGADLVSCQHSHCIGTRENYLESEIIYGQGNTLFGFRNEQPSWNEGLLVELLLSRTESGINKQINYKLLQTKPDGTVQFATDSAEKIRLEEFREDSKLLEDNFIKSSWIKYCTSKRAMYYSLLFGHNRLAIHLNRLLGNKFINFIYSKNNKRISQNIIRCEAHNEVLATILNLED